MRRGPHGAPRYPGRVARFYVTTPIYYVNDAPHIGHAYTTVTADALARWHRLLGDDVFFLTGTDEHGLKVQRAAEANGLTPQEQADRYSARFRETLGNCSTSPTTTSSAPPSPATTGRSQALMQAAYDNGWIKLGTYEGLYCVACEAYYTEDELVDGALPDPPPAGGAAQGGELLLPLVGVHRPPARVVRRQPGRGHARGQAQRGPRPDQGRPAGHLHLPHLARLGRAGAVGPEARLLRLVRRADQLRHRRRLRRRTRAASTPGGRPSTT